MREIYTETLSYKYVFDCETTSNRENNKNENEKQDKKLCHKKEKNPNRKIT